MRRRLASKVRSRGSSREDGISLIEAIVAIVVLVTVTAGVAHLLVWSRRAIWSAGTKSMAVMLAAQKLENLESLSWEVDSDGLARSDASTDLSTHPPGANGTGLLPSPPNVLSENAPQFADFLDGEGRWLGNGSEPPARAVYVRRWSIEPFPPDGANTLVFTVVVLPRVDVAKSASFVEQGVRLTTIKTRVVRR